MPMLFRKQSDNQAQTRIVKHDEPATATEIRWDSANGGATKQPEIDRQPFRGFESPPGRF
ncbi:MAG: hypothetical protein WD904_06935 [Dehalococcoidia bacterium]